MIKIKCRKCLFEQLDPDGIYAQISDMIAALPPASRTLDEEYKRRLAACSECDSLGEGTCGKCGCFVELRAAKANMHCPHESKRW